MNHRIQLTSAALGGLSSALPSLLQKQDMPMEEGVDLVAKTAVSLADKTLDILNNTAPNETQNSVPSDQSPEVTPPDQSPLSSDG